MKEYSKMMLKRISCSYKEYDRAAVRLTDWWCKGFEQTSSLSDCVKITTNNALSWLYCTWESIINIQVLYVLYDD